jgi:hypothetical protein
LEIERRRLFEEEQKLKKQQEELALQQTLKVCSVTISHTHTIYLFIKSFSEFFDFWWSIFIFVTLRPKKKNERSLKSKNVLMNNYKNFLKKNDDLKKNKNGSIY